MVVSATRAAVSATRTVSLVIARAVLVLLLPARIHQTIADLADSLEATVEASSNGYAGEGRNLAKPDGGSALEVFCESKVSCRASFIKAK